MTTISVIVPVFRAEAFLRTCIESILQQSYQALELILVDDGSTDGSGRICDEYATLDSRVVVIHKKNGGVSSARNAGLDIATGEFVTFVDSDDWISQTFIQEAVRNCETNVFDIFMGGFCRVLPDGSQRGSNIPDTISNVGAMLTEKQYAQLMEFNYVASSCGKMIRRSLIGHTRFDNSMRSGEDLKFVFELMQKNPVCLATPDMFYYYRAAENSLTTMCDRSKLNDVLKTYRLLISFAEKMDFTSEFWLLIQERWRNDLLYLQSIIMQSENSWIKKFELLQVLHKDRQLNSFLYNCDDKYIRRYASNPLLLLCYQKYRSVVSHLRSECK